MKFLRVCLIVCSFAIASMFINILFAIPSAFSKQSSSLSSKLHKGKSSHGPRISRTNKPAGGINYSGNSKVVMINFDDGYKSQFLYAKPILDKYGYKATFFIPCAKMQTEPKWLMWQQITALQNDGMDIESHTMTHAHLPDLSTSPAKLTYEIGFAKQCLANHGFNTTIFGYPLNLGSENPTIVNLVSKYYTLAR